MFRNEKIVAAFLSLASTSGLAAIAGNLGTVAQYASVAAAAALFFAAIRMLYSVLFAREEETSTKDV